MCDTGRNAFRSKLAALWGDIGETSLVRYGRSCAPREFAFNPLDVAEQAAEVVVKVSIEATACDEDPSVHPHIRAHPSQECKRNPRARSCLSEFCQQALMAEFQCTYAQAASHTSSSQTIALNQQFIKDFVQSEVVITGFVTAMKDLLDGNPQPLPTVLSIASDTQTPQATVPADSPAETLAAPEATQQPQQDVYTLFSQLPQLQSPEVHGTLTQWLHNAINGEQLHTDGGLQHAAAAAQAADGRTGGKLLHTGAGLQFAAPAAAAAAGGAGGTQLHTGGGLQFAVAAAEAAARGAGGTQWVARRAGTGGFAGTRLSIRKGG